MAQNRLIPIIFVSSTCSSSISRISTTTSSPGFFKPVRDRHSSIGQHCYQLSCYITVLLWIVEGSCLADVADTTSTTNPVNILVHIIWQVVVDHVGNLRNVQTTSSYRRGDEDGECPSSEIK